MNVTRQTADNLYNNLSGELLGAADWDDF